MKQFLIIFILLFSMATYSQNVIPTLVWEKTYGGSGIDYLISSTKTIDGGLILCGFSYSTDGDLKYGNKGGGDGWIVKLNSIGDTIWERNYGGSKFDRLHTVFPLVDGGFLMCGSTFSTDGDIKSGNKGGEDAWIVRIDSMCNIVWEKTYGGTFNDALFDLKSTSDGGYILYGYANSSDGDVGGTNNGETDLWLVKINAMGNIIWEKNYGGTKTELPNCNLLLTDDGGYIFGANTRSSDGDIKTGNKGGDDYWIVKVNSIGTIEWEKTYGGSNDDYLWKIQKTIDGGYVWGGYTASSDGDLAALGFRGDYDVWITKINNTGNVLWSKIYGGSKTDMLCSLLSLPNGNFIFGGEAGSNDGDVKSGKFGSWLVEINSTGNILWEKTFGNSSGIIKDIHLTTNGSYLLTGYSNLYGSQDYWASMLSNPFKLNLKIGIGGILIAENNQIKNDSILTVYSGSTKTFTIIPDAGYEVSTLTFNNKDAKSKIISNKYTTPIISSDDTLNLTFKKTLYKIIIKMGNSSLNTYHYYGETPSFDFTPSSGSILQSVIYNNIDVTSELVDNIYTLPPIVSNGILIVNSVYTTTDNSNNPDSNIKIYTNSTDIIIDGLKVGEKVELYSILGIRLKIIESSEEKIVIPAQKNTIYCLKTKFKAYKIAL